MHPMDSECVVPAVRGSAGEGIKSFQARLKNGVSFGVVSAVVAGGFGVAQAQEQEATPLPPLEVTAQPAPKRRQLSRAACGSMFTLPPGIQSH